MFLHPRTKNLIGVKFGNLTVVEFSEYRKSSQNLNRAYWTCLCDCGNSLIVSSNSLLSDHTKSCGCQSSRSHSLPFGVSSANQIIRTYRRHAIERDLDFFLTKEDCYRLFELPCYYCGSEPSNVSKFKNSNGEKQYSGIDRVDNHEGYTVENCVPCCYICNRSKSDMRYEDFISWVKKVYDRQS